MVNALAPEVLPTLATLFPELDFTEMANFIAEVNAS